jgi:predicted RNA-binding protein with PIN domain
MLNGHQIVLVDGYNVTNEWLKAGFLQPGELAYVRQQLINILSSVAGYWDIQCYLVFDAHHVKDNTESCEIVNNYLSVIFTAENQTADSVIERLSAELASQELNILVCTSDWAEQNIVLTRGASRLSSREFLIEVQRAQNEMRREYSHNPPKLQRNWLGDSVPEDIKNALQRIVKKGPLH